MYTINLNGAEPGTNVEIKTDSNEAFFTFLAMFREDIARTGFIIMPDGNHVSGNSVHELAAE